MTHVLFGFVLLALAALNFYFDWIHKGRRSFYDSRGWKEPSYIDGRVFRFADRWFASAFLALLGAAILLGGS